MRSVISLKKMKRGLVSIAILFLVVLPTIAVAEPAQIADARALMAEGDFRGAYRLLDQAQKDKALSPAERLAIQSELAGFYENLVGDDRRALKMWQQMLRQAPADTPEHNTAQQATERIDDRGRRMAGLKQQLNALRMAAVQPGHRDDPAFRDKMARQRERLDQMTGPPDLAADIDYTLGLTHLALDHPLRADLAFGRVLTHRPAFGFQQPIERLRNTARQAWVGRLARQASWTVLAIFWLTTAAGLAWTRPWRWLKWRHVLAGAIALLIWTGCFQTGLHWPGRQSAAAEFVNRDGFYPTPTYVHTRLGAPESEIAQRLFYYGLAAVGGTFLLAVITVRLRRQGLRHLTCGIGGLCLGLALAVQFYYTDCDNLSRLYKRNDSAAAWLSAQLAFRASEPEQYLLTEPRAYPGVELASISDPLLVDWLAAQVPDARRVSNKETID